MKTMKELIEILKNLTDEELFYIFKDIHIFSNSLIIENYKNLLEVFHNRKLIFPLYIKYSNLNNIYIKNNTSASEYYFNLGFEKINKIKMYDFKEIFYTLHSLYIYEGITYNELKQITINLYKKNILKNDFNQNLKNLLIIKNELNDKKRNFKIEKLEINKLLKKDIHILLVNRFENLIKNIDKEIENINYQLNFIKVKYKNIKKVKQEILEDLKNDYKLCSMTIPENYNDLDEIKKQLFKRI
jgi:hypothetical protein